MSYKAYLKVTEYDYDFCFFICHKMLEEGETSRVYYGSTASFALGKLLADIQVGHPHYHLGVTIPESYGHVQVVRNRIEQMITECIWFQVPQNLYWGGNWDVNFVVEEVTTEKPKEETMEATIIPNAVKVCDYKTKDGIDWLEIEYDGDYDTYKASPVALMFQGKKYTRMSHNSDTMRISYRTGVPYALMLEV